MLSRQLEALRYVTEQLRREGAELAYHVHAPELAHGAREFHHMMLNTADLNMGFGLDPHWIYRGCGDSQIALDDVVRLYGARVILLAWQSTHVNHAGAVGACCAIMARF